MTTSKAQSPIEISRPASGERRLTELGITLSALPGPFGIYVEAVKEGSRLFLNGMFRTQGREANSSSVSARSCCERFLAKTGTLPFLCTQSQAFRLALQSNLKLFSRSVVKRCLTTEWRYLCFETCDHCCLLGLLF